MFSLLFLPSVKSDIKPLASDPKKELVGFLAMLLGVLVGVYLVKFAFNLAAINLQDANKWVQLAYVMASLAVALPLGLKAAQKAGFATLNQSLASYFSQQGAWAF